MLSFLFVEGSLIKKSSFEEFNPVFITAEFIVCLKCKEGSNVFAEFLGTFFTLWPRKVRFWKEIYSYMFHRRFIHFSSALIIREITKCAATWDRFCVEFCHVLSRFYLRERIRDPDSVKRIALKDELFGYWIKIFKKRLLFLLFLFNK